MVKLSLLVPLELRKVVRAAALYVGVVWGLAPGILALSPVIGLPGSTARAFLIASAVGFPFWVVLTWFYEFAPQGFRHGSAVARSAAARIPSARGLDFVMMGALTAAVVLVGTVYFVSSGPSVGSEVRAAVDPPAKSVAVLPFAGLDQADPKQQLFGDGVARELTDTLARNAKLTVVAWDVASRYGNGPWTPAEIGKALHVAHILDGDVQRDGKRIRVSAELVDAATGRQLWSAQYDAPLVHGLAAQDEISGAIADALKMKFTGFRAAPAARKVFVSEPVRRTLPVTRRGTCNGTVGRVFASA